MEPPPPWRPDLETRDLDEYNTIQVKLLWQLADQIAVLYPKATLHIITNEDHVDRGNMVFHKLNFPPSHVAKIHMYGLLDEPCMYMDSDILFMDKFTEEELDCEGPFNFFGSLSRGDVQKNASKPLPCPVPVLYNAGLVWIPRPSAAMVEEMMALHQEYFANDKEILVGDEAAASLYVFLHDIKMKYEPRINVHRGRISNKDLSSQQTVHYSGYDIKLKRLCLEEYKQYALSKNMKLVL